MLSGNGGDDGLGGIGGVIITPLVMSITMAVFSWQQNKGIGLTILSGVIVFFASWVGMFLIGGAVMILGGLFF